jgi:TolB protein
MDVTTRQWVQLTHDSGVNDFPSWSPDGRHIVYESKQGGRSQIWSMLADGTKQHALTSNSDNSQPNWSWK